MAVFNLYVNTVQDFEGGFQKMSSDPGNYNSRKELVGTNHGISAQTYERWLGYPPSELDMRSITKKIAIEIFESWYWNKIKGSLIKNQAVAENIVDHAINSGVYGTSKLVQRVLNNEFGKSLVVDGVIGIKTISEINKVDPLKLFKKISQYRLDYYKRINNKSWWNVWRNRVYSLAQKFNIPIEKKK
ncbi:hypothetical protein ACIVBQ_000551 [Tenacibaculum discolor]